MLLIPCTFSPHSPLTLSPLITLHVENHSSETMGTSGTLDSIKIQMLNKRPQKSNIQIHLAMQN